jgi:hypothetical protein
MKATINIVDKVADPEHEEIMVLFEIGIDAFEVIASLGIELSDWHCMTLGVVLIPDGDLEIGETLYRLT